MNADDVRRFIQPEGTFHPFIVRTAGGHDHRVVSPETVWMSPDGLLLIVYDPAKGVTMIDTDDVTECHR